MLILKGVIIHFLFFVFFSSPRKGDEISLNDQLQILITAGLNEGLSVGQINRDLRKLAKHQSLQKLKIGIEIDKSLLKEISKLSSELNKAAQLLREKSNVTVGLTKSVDNAKSSLQSEVDAIQSSNKALSENLAMRQKIKQTVEDLGEGQTRIREDIYTTIGNRFENKTTHGVRYDGGAIQTNEDEFTIIKNPEAYREAQKALQLFTDDANHRLQMLTRTFSESSDEINSLKTLISQLTPESSKTDFSRITNEIKKLEQSEKLLNQAYKENEQFNKRRQQQLDATKNRIAALTTEIQRFNRAGKELPYGKGQALDNMLTDLKNIDVTNFDQANKKLNELESSFKRLNQTALAREGLLKQLNNMKLDGVIDEKEITKLETAIRKAETPEQIRKLGQEYGKLRREQQLITQVLDKKPSILKQINNLREQGLITEKQALTLEKELANAQTKRAVSSVKKQVDDIQAEVGLRQKNLNLLRQTEITINRLTNNPLARRYRGELASLNTELQRINLSGQATANRLKEIQHRLREIGVEATGVTYKTSTLMGAFKNAIVKFPIWMGASTAFFGTVRGIRSALRNIIEVDTQMTTLARVSGGELDRNHILREAGDLAAKLGNELKAVNESIIDFARQGFRGEGLMALTEAATLFSNISEMSPEEASSGLTAIIKGFNMLPEQVMVAVDAINEVDNNFAHSSQNIVASIAKSVGAAQAFGVSLQEVVGYTTAIGEVTRESGNIIGNSLKTIFSRITTIDSSIEALNSIGVAVHEIRDGVESVRPVSDILTDLASKWKGLSAEQQQNIGLQIAGRFQLSRFLVLMQQFDRALEATNTALNSQGSGYRENEQYLKSLEARINKLKNAWTDLTLTMGDVALTDSFIGIVEVLNRIANRARVAIDTFGLFPTVLMVVGSTFGAFSKKSREALSSYARALFNIDAANKLVASSNSRLAQSMSVATASTRAMTVATVGLTTALRGLLLSTGIGAILAGIGFVVEKLITHFSNKKKEAKELKETLDRTTDSMINHRDRVEELIESYKTLSEVENKTLEQQQDFLLIQEEISSLMPSLVAYVDSTGKKHLYVGDQLERQLQLLERIAEIEQQRRINLATEAFENELKGIKDLERQYLKALRGLTEYDSRTHTYKAKSGHPLYNQLILIEQILAEIEIARGRIPQQIAKLTRDIVDASGVKIEDDSIFGIIEEIAKSNEELSNLDPNALRNISHYFADLLKVINQFTKDDQLDRVPEAFTDLIGTFNQFSADNAIEIAINRIKEQFPEAAEKVDELYNSLIDLGKGTNEVNKAVAQTFHIYDENNVFIEEFTGTLDELKEKYEILDSVIDESDDSLLKYIVRTQEAEQEFKSLADAIKEPASELKTLNQILATLSKGQSLTAETVADLIVKYPELATGVQQVTDGYRLNEEALKALREIKIREATDAIQSEVNKTIATVTNTSSRLKAYEEELRAIQSLKDAQDLVASSAFAQYYGEDAYKNMSFDDATYTITIGDVTTNWADLPNQYFKIKAGLQRVANEFEDIIRIGNLQESRKELEKLLNDTLYGVSTSTSSSKTAAEVALEKMRNAYEEALREIRFFTEYHDWSIEQQIDAYEKLQQEHAEYLRQNLDAERDLLLTLKRLRDRALEEERKRLEERLKLIQDNRNAWEKNLNSALDSAIALIKRHYELQKEYALDAIKKEQDALDELHDQFMKAKDEELKKYEEVINAQLRQIDREYDQDTFDRELRKKQEEQLKIQRRINELSIDDSFAAQAEKAKLEEELAKIIEDIEEFKHKRTVDLRKQSLNDNLENKRKEIQQEKDSAQFVVRVKEQLFRGTYEAAKKWLDEQAKATEAYWQNEIENETRFQELRTQALIGNLGAVQNELDKFAQNVASAMFNVGQSMRQNIANEISNIQNLLRNTGDMTTYDREKREAWEVYLANKKMAEDYYKATGTWDMGLHEINNELRRKYGFEDGSYDELKNKVVRFNTGGYTGSFKGPKWGLLDQKELVLNQVDTSNILQTVKLVRDLVGKVSLPKLSTITRSGESVQHYYDIKMNIDKIIGDKSMGKTLYNEYAREMDKRGIKRR